MIIISPYSRQLPTKKENPKNYPFWEEVITLISTDIIQIGVTGETQLTKDFRVNLPLKDIEKLVQQCDTWISVDNFFPHLAHLYNKKGVVIWGKSDPLIFGYPENINLLKDRKYLRSNQFDVWTNERFDETVFMPPDEVIWATRGILDGH